eukprot:gene11571-4817_t
MVKIEVGEPEEIIQNNDELLNEKIKHWRLKAPINTQETEKELSLPSKPSFSKSNVEFISLYDQSPFSSENTQLLHPSITAPRRNLGSQTDYQRRYQLERSTRTFLQNLFSAVEHSSLFQWFRNLSQKDWQNSDENSEGRINRRQRRGYGGYSNYGGGSYGTNYYYGSNYSKQEAFIENLVTKWLQFRNSVIGGQTVTPEEEIRTDREFARDLADKIDRYSNQESRYFNRNPNYRQKPTFFQKEFFWL